MSTIEATRRTARYRGREVLVIEAGEGPTVTYLHGMLGNPGIHPFIEALARGRRVVAPCLPGFWGSETDEELRELHDWVMALSEIIDSAGVTGEAVVASSIGAMLALELQAIRPESFDRMVLMAPFGLWDDSEPIDDLFAHRGSTQAAVISADPERAALFWQDDPGLDPEEQLRRGTSRYHSRRAAAQLVWSVPDFGLSRRLHRVTCPTGLVWGTQDQIIPSSYAERFAQALPSCMETVLVDGAGHALEWDRPEEAAAAVERILDS